MATQFGQMNLSRQSSGETPEPPPGPVYPPSLMPQPSQQPGYVIASTGQQLPTSGFSGSGPSISQQVLQAPPSPQGFVQQPPPAHVSKLLLIPVTKGDLWFTWTSLFPGRISPVQHVLLFRSRLTFPTCRTWSALFISCAKPWVLESMFNKTDPTVHATSTMGKHPNFQVAGTEATRKQSLPHGALLAGLPEKGQL